MKIGKPKSTKKALEDDSRAFFRFGGAFRSERHRHQGFSSPFSTARRFLPFSETLHTALRRLSFALCALTIACGGTTSSGVKVKSLAIEELPNGTDEEVRAGLATRKAEKLFGLFEREYRPFDPEALKTDLLRIERQLRRRGYYDAKVRAARVISDDEEAVRVSIEVVPGTPVKVSKVSTQGLSDPGLELAVAERALASIHFKEGDLFDEDAYSTAQTDLANSLADSGYAYASVTGTADIDLENHQAAVTLVATLGRKAKIGKISLVGLKELPEKQLRRVVGLNEGDPYSRRELISARAALYELGVFSSVQLDVDTTHPDRESVDVVLRFEEAPLRTLSVGAGGRLDVQRLAATGRVTWSDKNFLGGLRTLTISTRPALTLFPTRVDNLDVAPTALFPENALSLRLTQPAFIEGRTEGFIETGLNVYPLLYPLPAGLKDPNVIRQLTVLGYLEIPSSIGVSRSFFGRTLPLTLSYNYRYNHPFLYQPAGKPDVEDLFITYPEVTIAIDRRDDPLSPTQGVLLSLGAQRALPILGSDVSDWRLRPEIRFFWPLDTARQLVFAVRGTMGFLFPESYGATLSSTTPNIIDQHKLLFRAFYSGGPDSNRGYPYQRVGPQGRIAFLTPGIDCDLFPDQCTLPLGGLSLWEASVELRYRFLGPWALVLFADTSDVNMARASFSFAAPHLSVGPGLRYASPVGPIRVDLGYRVPGAQKIGSESADEPPDITTVTGYQPQDSDFPVALHILIGEAF